MALSADQYSTLKRTLRALLSGNTFSSPNLGEAALLGFWNQLTGEAAAGVALSANLDQSIDFAFRAQLCASIARVADADWLTFFSQLSSDSSGAASLSVGQYAALKLQMRAVLSVYSLSPGTVSEATLLGYLKTRVSISSFAALFPTAYQFVQTDLGLLYGSVPLATAGNTSTTIVALTGVCAGVPVPIWWKATNTLAIGSGATFNIYYDGTGTTPAMTGVTPTAGVPVALTGAGTGMSATWLAGTSVNNDTWKATCAGLTDQSGNGYDYTQLTPSAQPVVTTGLNGKPGLLFDGVNDLMNSAVVVPTPGTTPWRCALVARRPTAAAANARMLGPDSIALILNGATTMAPYNGTFGPTATGLPTNTWGAIDYKSSFSASDSIQEGSGPIVTGTGLSNSGSAGASIVGGAAPANIEVLAVGYVPDSGFSTAAFRAAVTSLYGATVNV